LKPFKKIVNAVASQVHPANKRIILAAFQKSRVNKTLITEKDNGTDLSSSLLGSTSESSASISRGSILSPASLFEPTSYSRKGISHH